tara:strand:+ start:47 stop:559 length:513 start_codon:yes stop_codon:yes gene_type:complete
MRKQRKLIEQDKERKKIPTRIEDTFRRNGEIGASPAERREKKQEKIKEVRRKQVKRMRESLPREDIVARARNGKPKKMKRPAPDVGVVLGGPFKSELQRGLDRVEQIKKQQAKDDAAFKKKVAESKKNRGRATGTSPTAGRDIRSKQFIGKKMNMGGVMKGRGGTFKGVY